MAGVCFTTIFSTFLSAQVTDQNSKEWHYYASNISNNKDSDYKEKPILIAVVDDGFLLSHKEVKDFLYRNPNEINYNGKDDDGNGYVDDIIGWDISDADNDASVSEANKSIFYHGTYISSIIANVAKRHYGEIASERIKIIPIKAVSDFASKTYIKDGYKGIKYAIDNGADVICLAWSGGDPSAEEIAIIREAEAKGILIVGSAGNFNTNGVSYPAAFESVLAVAAVNQDLNKAQISAYGMEVGISAPGEAVFGGHSDADNAYFFDSGTSPAAAIVAACAAILYSKPYVKNASEVSEALLNTATLFPQSAAKYSGRLGAGVLNLEAALEYISRTSKNAPVFEPSRTRGIIRVSQENGNQEWQVRLKGGFEGVYLKPYLNRIRQPEKIALSLTLGDTIWNTYALNELPNNFMVPSSDFKVTFETRSLKKDEDFRLEYFSKPIDSTQLYCKSTPVLITLENETGILEDGSEGYNYSNDCSCKWIIFAPKDKKIKLVFENLDTEAKKDKVYLFNGNTTMQDNLLAIFSGNNPPPIVTSSINEVMVWFVSDSQKTGQGWRLRYEVID